MQQVRGDEVALIPQDPMTSLNPTMTIGRQIGEGVRLHRDVQPQQARDRALEVLDMVEMPRPGRTARPVPPRALGRTAPAGHDRHGAGLRAQAADRRRAHHRARRHHPGPDPRPHRRPAPAPAHGGGPHHPRHGRHRRPNRPRGGHVRRQGGRGGRRPVELFGRMRHPYSEALLASVPKLDQQPGTIGCCAFPGLPPDLSQTITNCRFAPRCQYATDQCRAEDPPLRRTWPAGSAHTASPASTRSTTDRAAAGRSRAEDPRRRLAVSEASTLPRQHPPRSTDWSRSSR